MPVIAQVTRDVMQDFEETRDIRLQKDDAFQSILRVQKQGMDYGQSQQTYETWNGDDYDTQMLAVGYKAPLWAVDYLMHLKLDSNVRILDVCCGTGLVARYLREKGFTNIDALDSSEAMLQKAKKKDLYKNYFCCPIGEGKRAPIAEGQYDVVTVAGGFAEGHMKPDAFEEMLRVLKVGGYVINVMRDENRRKVAIYKDSFDAQCRKLVEEGKWERVFEHVNPNYYMKLHGLVQVYRKKETLTKDEAFRRIMQVQIPGMTYDQSQTTYVNWHGDAYDTEMLACGYKAPEWAVDYFLDLNLDSSVRILDVCSGTGLVAKFLKAKSPAGRQYANIDALDSSKEMLQGAKKLGIYKKFFCCPIGGDCPPAPIADDEYDVVIIAGGFAEGHMEPTAFDEMLRVLKKGGYIINVMREENRRKCIIYKNTFDKHCQDLVDAKMWTKIYEHINEKYYMDYTGLVQVYQKPDPNNPWKPTEKQAANWESILRVQIKGMNWDQSQQKYEKWHGDDYDNHMLAVGYKAPEWAVDYLLKLDLEPSARILDVAAGTGLISKFLKAKAPGKFLNIEALDSSREMLDAAKEQNLYKEYHQCMIGGGHRPDLKEDYYDVITIAGGFAEAHLEVDAFDEMLRLLKVGGYIINVMREENRHKCVIYKDKFVPHCAKLVQDKKWELVHEHVNPHYYMNFHGLVQVYRKTLSITPPEAYEKILKVQRQGLSWLQSQDAYLGLNGRNYEEAEIALGYRGAEWAADYLSNLNLPKDSKILDVCAGTGLVGKHLQGRGFTNLEALDSCREMLKGSVGRGYRKLHIACIGCDDLTTCIGVAQYDALTCAGGFAEAHLTPAAFWEMVKLTRPGGFIVNVMREADRRDCNIYKDHFDALVQRLVDEGRVELVFSHINGGYAAGEDGLVQVFKVKQRAHLKPGYWTGNAPEDQLDEEDR